MTATAIPFKLPSPLRMLRALHARLVAADGPTLEHEILIDEVNRETDEIIECVTEAKQIETGVEHFAATWKAALADGKIDDTELRTLTREFTALKQPPHHHTQHLKELL